VSGFCGPSRSSALRYPGRRTADGVRRLYKPRAFSCSSGLVFARAHQLRALHFHVIEAMLFQRCCHAARDSNPTPSLRLNDLWDRGRVGVAHYSLAIARTNDQCLVRDNDGATSPTSANGKTNCERLMVEVDDSIWARE